MCDLYTNPINFWRLYRHFSNGLVTGERDILRSMPSPPFLRPEVIAPGMATESGEIGSGNWSFGPKLEGYRASMPGLRSHCQSDGRPRAETQWTERQIARLPLGLMSALLSNHRIETLMKSGSLFREPSHWPWCLLGIPQDSRPPSICAERLRNAVWHNTITWKMQSGHSQRETHLPERPQGGTRPLAV